MVKNILILSSDYTGHGHKSITDALNEQFRRYPDVKVHVIDGFTLGGNMGLKFGKLYGSVTRNAKDIWKLVWEISLKKPSLLNEFTEFAIRDSFLELLKKLQPDLILSVHPNFNGSVLNILNEYKINIPFLTFIADLVSISPLWTDPRADHIICPTEESKAKCIECGVPESKTIVLGFPIRSKFCHVEEAGTTEQAAAGKDVQSEGHIGCTPLECLIMSGGEGSGNMASIARILLKNFNCRVKIITGRNRILKRRLEYTFQERFGNRLEIYGFVDNIQELMYASNLIFTRGSPNAMMEAVMCNTPVVVTGALPGQEEGNPGYMEKYNLGVVCKDMRKLKTVVTGLLANNAEKLNQIRKSQNEFRNPDIAKNIVDFILGIEKRENTVIPDISPRPGRMGRLKASLVSKKQ